MFRRGARGAGRRAGAGRRLTRSGGPDPPPAPPQPAVVKLLVSFNAHHERVVFSDMVVKVNRKGLNQRRVLLVTNRGIYNLERNKVRGPRSPPAPPRSRAPAPPTPSVPRGPRAPPPRGRAPRPPGDRRAPAPRHGADADESSASGESTSARWG